MSIKGKLILIGICVGIIILVFTVNVVRKIQGDNQDVIPKDISVDNVITRAEAYRLLSYLDYDKTEREAIPFGITYAKEEMSGWYDTYVNAVWKMGLIEGNVTAAPKEALTYGACKELVDKLIITKPDFQSVYEGLSFAFTKADQKIQLPEFLELYSALMALLPEKDKFYKEETLLVLGRDITEDGRDRMVTDQGKYYYLDAQDYIKYMDQAAGNNQAADLTPGVTKSASETDADTAAASENEAAVTEAADIAGNKDNSSDSFGASTDEADGEAEETGSDSQKSLIEQYMDQGIKVLTCGQEIIYITGTAVDKIVIHNVWIKKGMDLTVDTFVNGLNKSFQAKFKLSNEIEKVIGDLTIENRKIVQISVKPDMIQGKVLRTGEDYIEIDGYGAIPLDVDYKIYKTYGTLSMEPTSSILVGYENTNFIVSEGKISAAIITDSIKAENIRVLIQTTGYKSIYHDKVLLTATGDFTVSSEEGETSYKTGDIVTIELDSELLAGQRIMVKTASEDSKLQLLSIERSCGNPKYRGTLEIAEGEKGLLIVNELPLEEYLYAVIPSEMPTGYGAEALKVQAVCARSYAYKHLLANSLGEYGAHVNDSVAYQVYNNIAENEDSILAVKDTYGKVIKYDGEVINAFYFSTSCGHTADAASVWANNIDFPYLNGKLMLVEDNPEGVSAQSEDEKRYENLSSEDSFRDFITAKDVATYDSSFNWYRWKVTMDIADVTKVVNDNVAARYNANPDLILTMTKEGEDGIEPVFESLPVDSIGDIMDVSVLKRESSGIIMELLIKGSKKTIKVLKEYNIRTLLAPVYDSVTRMDDSEVENLGLLPSAFFTFDKEETNGKLSSITIIGGGYGHGVGMSQNGVKALADSGKSYEDIIKYFYNGIKMGFIYE